MITWEVEYTEELRCLWRLQALIDLLLDGRRKGRRRAWGRLKRLICRRGSVIADLQVAVNTTDDPNAGQAFVSDVQEQVQSGSLGNFTLDANHPLGAKLTTTTVIGDPTSTTPTNKSNVDDMTLILLILLSVFIGVLVLALHTGHKTLQKRQGFSCQISILDGARFQRTGAEFTNLARRIFASFGK
ncbi:uncharacterized protein LOC116604690 [Nematostella vectensis]|uniref:uncharacterized protein LOC116604690 n=1 Tax=Nematostella vectensis TaxID=45351 RepID=UPI00138FB120|nr:uncharacterized protein LOC116604690 [Nematostella vectensis]